MQELTDILERDNSTFNAIISKAIQAQRASEAAKKARDLVRRKNVLVKSTLPGKLADCTSTDLSRSEIFIVEGDSAGQHSYCTFKCLVCLHPSINNRLMKHQQQ